MKHHILIFNLLLVLLLLSCGKEEKNVESQIHVVDSENKGQVDVQVDIYKVGDNLTLINSGQTNSKGTYVYTFTETGDFKIMATRIDSSLVYENSIPSTETFCGEKALSITQNTKVDCTIYISHCN